MKKLLLLLMCVAFFACGESEQDEENIDEFGYESSQSDMSSSEEENSDITKKQNVGGSGSLDEKTPFRNEDIAGEWTVRMRVTSTNCEDISVGAVKEEKWFVNFETGVLNIQIMDKGNPVEEYWGKFSGMNIEAVADKMLSEQEPFPAEESSKPVNKISLKVGDRNNIMGTRTDINIMESRKISCRTIYEVDMRR